jgi:hypothetical protein
LSDEYSKYKNIEHWLRSTQEKQTIREIMNHGCVSGVVSELIYYSDTVKFYDAFEDEIWNRLDAAATNMGSSDIISFMGIYLDTKHIGSLTQFKNDLTWWAVEDAANDMEIEVENE